MRLLNRTFWAAGLLACALHSHAAPVTVTSITAVGTNHDLALVIDGNFPANGTDWTDAQTVWWVTNPDDVGILLTFDQTYTLQDATLTVDNNDDYVVETSLDGVAWAPLFAVTADTGPTPWGLDNFSSDAGSPVYSAPIDFAPTAARFARIRALNGDGLYSVGELQFAAAVPEPATTGLLLAGLGTVAALARRRHSARPGA